MAVTKTPKPPVIIPPPPKMPTLGAGGYWHNGRWYQVIDVGSLDNTSPYDPTSQPAEPAQATVAGDNALIPLVYGTRRIGARIAGCIVDAFGNLWLIAIWCEGPVNGFVKVEVNDAAAPAGVTIWNYLGTTPASGYTGNDLNNYNALKAAYAAKGISFTDQFERTCWSLVVVTPTAQLSGFPNLAATIQGRKCAIPSLAYVVTNGSSSYAETADSAGSRIAGDFTVEACVLLNDWTPSATRTIVGKWGASGSYGWRLRVTTTGALSLSVSSNGTAETVFTSSAVTGFTDGTTRWIRAAYRGNNGSSQSDVKFYTSTDGITWTQLGTTQTSTVIASLATGSTTGTRIGRDGAGYYAMTCWLARAWTPSAVAFEFSPWEGTASGTAWTSSNGEAWALTSTTIYAGMTAYTENPTAHTADYIRSQDYGLGKRVDLRYAWKCEARNDEIVTGTAGSEPRNRMSLSLDVQQDAAEWLRVLADYAHCWLTDEGGTYFMVPDMPTAVAMTFDSASIIEGTLQVRKRGARDQPTVVEVGYTSTVQTVWKDERYTEYFPGVLSGTVPRRASRLSKPGLVRHSEAVRTAIEKLNAATLSDVIIGFRAGDGAAALRVGDLIAVNHPIGFGPVTGYPTGKPFRLKKIGSSSPGRWELTADEFDPGLYSSKVELAPTIVDTTLPNPGAPPAVTNLNAVEETYQTRDRLWSSRVRVTWQLPATFPAGFVRAYRVEVFEGSVSGARVFTADVGPTEFITAALKEQVDYEIRVTVVSSTGALSTGNPTFPIKPLGKALAPSNVPDFTGFEAGGRVFLSWGPAIDISEDVLRYEVRQGPSTATWDTATLVTRVDSLGYVVEGLPAGTYLFLVKAQDSVGGYSPSASTVAITVSLDEGAFNTLRFTASAVKPLGWSLARTRVAPYYVSDWADGAEYGATTTDNATGKFNDAAPGSGEDLASPRSGAIEFDGSDDYVDVNNVAAHQLSSALTLMAWVYPVDMPLSTFALLARKDTESGTRYTWGLYVDTDGKVYAQYYNGTSYIRGSDAVLPNREWSHVAMTISGTTMTLFVNGVQQGATVTLGGTIGAPTGRMSFGRAPPSTTGGASYYSKVMLKRVKLYNVALSAANVLKASAYGGVPPGITGCVGSWRMDDKADGETTTTVTDATGTQNGTLSGGAWRSRGALLSEAFDLGYSVSGLFAVEAQVTALTGAPRYVVELSTDGTTFTRYEQQLVAGVARYFKVGVDTDPGGSLSVLAGSLKGSVATTPRSETSKGSVSYAATGRNTVVLQGLYGQCNIVKIQPSGGGGAGYFAQPDNIKVAPVGIGGSWCVQFENVSTARASRASLSGIGTSLTVECWVRFGALTGAFIWDFQMDAPYTSYFGLAVDSNGVLFHNTGAGVDAPFYVSGAAFKVTTGRWYHIAIVFDGAQSQSRLYVDGVYLGAASVWKAPTSTSTARTWALMDAAATGFRQIGDLYDVRVWTEARTAQQIADNYRVRVATGGNLKAYWKMQDASGSTLVDAVAGANMTLGAGTVWNPINGFDGYVFTATAARTAASCFWEWEGA